MSIVVREVKAKSILTASEIYPYTINPYIGCQHGCSYCYARFMKRFTGHKEPWGEFVDVKINAAELLRKEIGKKKKAAVWLSGVCDPYQPLERDYEISRHCLQILVEAGWPVVIQTRSPLVLRDVDLLDDAKNVDVGLSIPTADDSIRNLFEPKAPTISERIDALAKLREVGIRTYAMIAPILPRAETLVAQLAGKVDYILLDRMNYHHANSIYRNNGLEDYLTEGYFRRTITQIKGHCYRLGIDCSSV